MGWAYCGQQMARVPKLGHPNGGFEKREIGYGIRATCDQRGCENVIDRGLGTVCGEMHHTPWDDEPGCGRYYCDDHHGWVGDLGGCAHGGIVAWGRTLCQPMRIEATGEVYCACLKDHPVEWPHGPRGINALRSELADVYPTLEEQDAWLDAPHPLLGGDAAGDLIGTDREAEVWALVDQLRTGAVV